MAANEPEKSNLTLSWCERFFSGRRYTWGLMIWMGLWFISIFIIQSQIINLKGFWGFKSFVRFGTVGVDINSYGTGTFNYFKSEETAFLWSEPYLEHILQRPDHFISTMANFGWYGYGPHHTISFPIIGFLWLWLLGAWVGKIKLGRWNKQMLGRVAILTLIPLFIFLGTLHSRMLRDRGECMINISNIQRSIRGHQGVRNLGTSKPIPWNDVLEPFQRECPSGGEYLLRSNIPDMGVLGAECPNPDHQRIIKAMDTSTW